MTNFPPITVLGGGEYGSAIVYTLFKAGLPVVLVVKSSELYLRRPVCFAEAIHSGLQQIDDVSAVLVDENVLMNFESDALNVKWKKAVQFHIQTQQIPVVILEELPDFVEILQPEYIVRTDRTLFPGITMESAPLVIGLHPVHTIYQHCNLSIESRQNYFIGDVYVTPPDSEKLTNFDFHFFKQPWETINSPLEGVFISSKNIGDNIARNESLGKIEDIEIRSPFDGQIWGLYHSGKIISVSKPLGLIYQGPPTEAYHSFSFAHKVVAGTALREILHFRRF
ncbi:MAG: hypothetical protein JXL67_03115 [Calditrichaeota bacterium]|nr:hypothetical protein [Calditrichota bacterium]